MSAYVYSTCYKDNGNFRRCHFTKKLPSCMHISKLPEVRSWGQLGLKLDMGGSALRKKNNELMKMMMVWIHKRYSIVSSKSDDEVAKSRVGSIWGYKWILIFEFGLSAIISGSGFRFSGTNPWVNAFLIFSRSKTKQKSLVYFEHHPIYRSNSFEWRSLDLDVFSDNLY